jgi:hypothetical protein
MIETRNMILAIALSVLIVVGFNFYKSRQLEEMEAAQTTEQATQVTPSAPSEVPAPSDTAAPQPGAPVPATLEAPQAPSRKDVLSTGQRVRIDSRQLHGSIALTGAKLDDLTLANYHETISPTSPEIVLLSPPGAANTYFAQFGWVGANAVAVPDADTVWTADGKVLEPGAPLTLTWDNGEGLRFSGHAPFLWARFAVGHAQGNALFHSARRAPGCLQRNARRGRLRRPPGNRQDRGNLDGRLDRNHRQILADGPGSRPEGRGQEPVHPSP